MERFMLEMGTVDIQSLTDTFQDRRRARREGYSPHQHHDHRHCHAISRADGDDINAGKPANEPQAEID